MKRRVKITATIIAMLLVLSVMMFGVYAAAQTKITIKDSISVESSVAYNAYFTRGPVIGKFKTGTQTKLGPMVTRESSQGGGDSKRERTIDFSDEPLYIKGTNALVEYEVQIFPEQTDAPIYITYTSATNLPTGLSDVSNADLDALDGNMETAPDENGVYTIRTCANFRIYYQPTSADVVVEDWNPNFSFNLYAEYPEGV